MILGWETASELLMLLAWVQIQELPRGKWAVFLSGSPVKDVKYARIILGRVCMQPRPVAILEIGLYIVETLRMALKNPL